MWTLVVAASFLQQPGRTTFDTKFDLTADPMRFLMRALHLWNAEASLGELQNQAYGYLFPQGPFFVVGELLHLPDWVVQRLWSALLLGAAYQGARLLASALGIGRGSVFATASAGLAYAVAPRLLSEVGSLSGEIVPTVVLPWVVLPLVHAQSGRITPRSAGLLAGVAVLFMGGLNAVENLATLPLPFLLAALGPRAVRLRLCGWLSAAVAAAAAWWMLPLLVLSRHSPPFLDYIESAAVTTRPLSLSNVVRGADHWLQYFTAGGAAWWPAGHALATEPLLVLATGLVAAVGLAGLVRPGMPARAPLTLSALLGLACLYAGHAGSPGSPLADVVRALLDGPLAAFRNVHKVDPLVRLPLALGFGYAGAHLRASAGWRAVGTPRAAAARGWAVPLALMSLLIVSAGPVATNDLRTAGWDAVPKPWVKAADYLARHRDGSRALVVPGSGFARQRWGTTIDEPLQGLARSPWVTRNQVPLTPGQTIRFLDAIEARLDRGSGSGSLADDLARSGIGFIVNRHDLDRRLTDAASSARVTHALERSPGITRVASYGAGGSDRALVDIYRVKRPVALAQAVALSSVRTVSGAAEDVITALESGLLGATQPTVMAGETGWSGRASDFVADGYRLRERQFGRTTDAVGATMTVRDHYRQQRAVHDYPGTPGTRRVHLSTGSIARVEASSSSGYADTLGPVRPEFDPYAAVDGGLQTAWLSAPFTDPTGQWIELHFARPVPVGKVRILADTDITQAEPVLAVRVRAGERTEEAPVDRRTGRAAAAFDGTPVRSLRVTITRVSGTPQAGVVGLRDVSVSRLFRRQELEVPRSRTTDFASWIFGASPGARACVPTVFGPGCDATAERRPEAEVELARRFTMERPGRLFVSAHVVAKSTPSTAVLTEPFGKGVRVRARSWVFAQDPAVSGQFAFDDDLSTSWVGRPGPGRQVLRLRWNEPRTLARLQVVNSLPWTASPDRAILRSGAERRFVDLTSSGFGFFAPLRTDHMRIIFPKRDEGSEAAPLGVAELKIPALHGLRYKPKPTTRTGSPCGFGPEVLVDGRARRSYVVGSLDQVLNGEPLRVGLCGGPIELSAGRHRISMRATEQWAPVQVVLSPQSTPSTEVTSRSVRIARWDATERSLEVDAGPAALLRVPENANDGWRATLHGTTLTPTRADGWQQAWLLPPGAGGLVRLTFEPDGLYRSALLTGALSALLLVAAACGSLVLERRRGRVAPPHECVEMAPRRPRLRVFTAALGVLLAGIVGGLPVLGGCVVALVLRRARWPLEAATGVLLTAAAMIAAVGVTISGGDAPDTGLAAANVTAGVGIGLMCVALFVESGAPSPDRAAT